MVASRKEVRTTLGEKEKEEEDVRSHEPIMSSRQHMLMVPDKGRQRRIPDSPINNSSIGHTRTKMKRESQRPQTETEEEEKEQRRTRRDKKTIRTALMASALSNNLLPPLVFCICCFHSLPVQRVVDEMLRLLPFLSIDLIRNHFG